MKSLSGLSADEIYTLIAHAGFGNRHAVSIANNIYKKRIADIRHFINIPKTLTELLEKNFTSGIYPPAGSELSVDGSVKYIYGTDDARFFESVFLPELKRNTVCVSTQSGCRMGCSFCVTGAYGYHGNLTAGEIVNQVVSIPQAARITHVVFMGMGEPLDNLGNVLKACNIMTSEWGLSLSPRNITVSTVGITPGIMEFLQNTECNLVVSLFSPFPDERRELVPAENRFPVKEIIEILKGYKLKKKRRLSLAYVMIKDVNDTERHLNELIQLLKGSGIRVNLLPYHPGGKDIHISSSPDRLIHFKHTLVMTGISASIRKSRGADISAACGLLARGLREGNPLG